MRSWKEIYKYVLARYTDVIPQAFFIHCFWPFDLANFILTANDRAASTAVNAGSKYSNCMPNSFTFNNGNTALFYLGARQEGGQQEIMRVDVTAKEPKPEPLLQQDWASHISAKELTREEQLLRERQRSVATGVTSISYHAASDTLLFPYSGDLFVLAKSSSVSSADAQPVRVPPAHGISGARMDPKFHPADSDVISFVRSGELWLVRVSTGIEMQLTDVRKGQSSPEDVAAGMPSFIIQEEFDRYTGYWWAPQADKKGDFSILYEVMDERNVRKVSIPDHVYPGSQDDFIFPRPGDENATVDLRIVSVPPSACTGKSAAVPPSASWESMNGYFEWSEYIVRAGWLPDASHAWAQLLDRKQQHTAIVIIPRECFSKDLAKPPYLFYEEKNDIWINITNNLSFLSIPNAAPERVAAVTTSEASGFAHVVLLEGNLIKREQAVQLAVTSGDWCVANGSVRLDAASGLLTFAARKETPLEVHSYSTKAANWQEWVQGKADLKSLVFEEPTLLTSLGQSHDCTISSDGEIVVDTASDIATPSVVLLKRSGQDSITLQQHPEVPEFTAPELFSYKSSHGHEAHGMVFVAENHSKKTPVLLYLYGGPHVQLVRNTFQGPRFLSFSMYAKLGYHVVVLDCRGSFNRGLAFEGRLRNSMGSFEIDEQVEGLQHIIAARPELNMDASRVAIHGWSYGGYMSLMGIAQRPDIFKVSIAGAPVTIWEVYDTGYTERYMDTPENNPDGYASGSVIDLADQFPEEPDRLLIVHGLIDENVHFHHTATLIDKLNSLGKPYRLQLYPQERHGIRKLPNRIHSIATMAFFLNQNL